MNRLVSLLIAALLLAAVAAFYFQVDRPAQERKAEEEGRQEVFLDIPRDRVDAIEIGRGGDTIRLERDAQRRWWLRAPEDAPARPAAVEDLLYEATTAGVLRRFTVAAQERGELGLVSPAATLHLAGEGIDVTLQVGIDAPTLEGRYYLGRSDGDTVIVTASPLRKSLQQPVEELRRRRLFDVPRWRTEAIEMHDGDRRLRLSQGEDGVWAITEPDLGRADGQRVSDWLDAVDQAEAPQLTSLEGEEAPLMVTGPWSTLRLVDDQQAEAVIRLSRQEGGDAVAYQEGLGFFGTLPASEVARLLPDGEALRDRHIAPIATYRVDRIELDVGGKVLTLARTAKGWTTGDDRVIADGIVDDYLRDLEKSEGTRYRDDQVGLEGDNPRLRLFEGERLLLELGFYTTASAVGQLPDGPLLEVDPALYSRLLPTIRRFTDPLATADTPPAPEIPTASEPAP
ncbi:MAG: DUF4340 domain-containing protein [Nitrospirota bacterium]|jgi:hypothetical protein